MIRANLATRPFYNERGVHFWLIAAAVLLIAATLLNVSRIIRYSRSDTELATQASRDEARAENLRTEAAQLRASVDPRQIDFTTTDARRANSLIDRRTFSWTELFNLFETTLPDNVRITAVRPRLDLKRGIVLTISAVAKGVDDLNQWMEGLEATGRFGDLGRALEEHIDDEGLLQATVETTYLPAAAPTARAADPGGRRP